MLARTHEEKDASVSTGDATVFTTDATVSSPSVRALATRTGIKGTSFPSQNLFLFIPLTVIIDTGIGT